jgi:hypothetical protein
MSNLAKSASAAVQRVEARAVDPKLTDEERSRLAARVEWLTTRAKYEAWRHRAGRYGVRS